jgi:hypothetical protein
MFRWYELEVEQKQKDRLQEAEHNRLLRSAEIGRHRSGRLRGRALVWLGHRLIESGKRLDR